MIEPLRVLMLSKACIVGIYQRKLEEIAALDIDLRIVVPPSWKDERGDMLLERVATQGYDLQVTPIRFNGSYHLHHYPELAQHFHAFRPHIVHIDEEPYNLATWHALWLARRASAKTLFFSWQNLYRQYPPPFRWGEQWVLKHIDYAIAGTDSAALIWRDKGYTGPLEVIPQFGVDPNLFCPASHKPRGPFTIGYFGRLVEEKGLHLLLDAVERLESSNWQLKIIGSGPQRSALEAQARKLGLCDRVCFYDRVPSVEMAAHYRSLDVFVLPSLTRSNWKEQFGRVLIEAMSSGIPVIGSSSGAIPDVVGNAGLIFPEGDVLALTRYLCDLQLQPEWRAWLGEQGRERVLEYYTHRRVAEATVEIYRMLADTLR